MLEGLPPNNAAHVLRLVCDEARARAAADLIVEFFDPAETAAAAFEDEASSANPKSWTLEVFFDHPPDEAFVCRLLGPVIGPELTAALVFDRVAERDWVASALEGLHAVRAGRFLVHGGHDRARAKPNDLALQIEAALAFGTGHHGTTRGCLLMLDGILKKRRPRRVLDLGTGTGVLAMASAKALHRRVVCGDIDPVAVAAARENARLNGVAAFVRPVVSVGTRHASIRAGAPPYDLIFANILARPLRLLAPSIAAVAAPHAHLVLSGLLPRDVPGVLSSYAAQGFALRRRLDLEGWATLLLA